MSCLYRYVWVLSEDAQQFRFLSVALVAVDRFFFVAAGISIQNLEDLDQVNGIQCPSWSAGQVPGGLEGSSNAWCHCHISWRHSAEGRQIRSSSRDISTHWLSFCWPVDGTANEPIFMMAAIGVSKFHVDPIRAIACYLSTFI